MFALKRQQGLNSYQYVTYCSEFNPREYYLLPIMWPEFHLTAPDTNIQLENEFHMQDIFMICGWADQGHDLSLNHLNRCM